MLISSGDRPLLALLLALTSPAACARGGAERHGTAAPPVSQAAKDAMDDDAAASTPLAFGTPEVIALTEGKTITRGPLELELIHVLYAHLAGSKNESMARLRVSNGRETHTVDLARTDPVGRSGPRFTPLFDWEVAIEYVDAYHQPSVAGVIVRRPPEPPREAIARAVGGPIGDHIRTKLAKVTSRPVAGLPEHTVWRVADENVDHPVLVHVGVWPDGHARVLGADPAAFNELAKAVSAHIDDGAEALAHARDFLEVTRATTTFTKVVTDPSELPWRPGSEAEEASKAALLASAPALAPAVKAADEAFYVELSVVVDQRLLRTTFTVERDGVIRSTDRVVARDLPFPVIL